MLAISIAGKFVFIIFIIISTPVVAWVCARVQPVLTYKNANYGNINPHRFSIFNFGTANSVPTLICKHGFRDP